MAGQQGPIGHVVRCRSETLFEFGLVVGRKLAPRWPQPAGGVRLRQFAGWHVQPSILRWWTPSLDVRRLQGEHAKGHGLYGPGHTRDGDTQPAGWEMAPCR